MFKTSEQLQNFIIWAKSQGVQVISVGKVTIQFSPYAVAEAQFQASEKPFSAPNLGKTELKNTSKQMVDTLAETQTDADKKEEEDLLFYSAK